MHISKWFPSHANRVERWLGKEEAERISQAMKGWYGSPIAVAGVPGAVYIGKDGDFVGPMRGGGVANLADFCAEHWKAAQRRWAQKQTLYYNAGFSSLSDLISEATAGKSRTFTFQKVGSAGQLTASSTLWYSSGQPAAGSSGGAAPAGTAPTSSTTGAFPFTNPTGGDTQHFVRSDSVANVAGNTLLLYDRLFSVAKTMSSSGTEAVTGVPTRYQSTTSTDADYAGNNFLTIEITSGLGNTAHNWTTCLYTNQGGTTNQTLPSVTGVALGAVNRLDVPSSTWFAPLASGDTGIKALTQMQCSTASLTGGIDFMIGHPIAFIPHPTAGFMTIVDGINSAFNLQRIFDSAALSFLEITKPATTATTYTGMFVTVAG